MRLLAPGQLYPRIAAEAIPVETGGGGGARRHWDPDAIDLPESLLRRCFVLLLVVSTGLHTVRALYGRHY